MSNDVGRKLSDFQWASVCQYITYVEASAGLKAISSTAVYSFNYARLGPEKLEAQKLGLQRLIKGNLKALEIWVGERMPTLGEEEKSVLRSYYRSIIGWEKLVDEQLRTIERLKEARQTDLFDTGEDNSDELPF